MEKDRPANLENVEIGFELEFVWPNAAISSRGKRRDTRVFNSVRDSLREFGCEDLASLVKITEDGTIDSGENGSGVEIITPPQNGAVAAKNLSRLLEWMRQSPASTNETAGLHINMSLADKGLNRKVSYLSLLESVPQKKILKAFQRDKNEYCEETSKTDIDISALAKKAFGASDGFASFESIRKALLAPGGAEKMLKEARRLYLEDLRGADKRIAIVEKRRRSRDGRYFEFRMTGNAGYENRIKEFEKVIAIYVRSLFNSVNGQEDSMKTNRGKAPGK